MADPSVEETFQLFLSRLQNCTEQPDGSWVALCPAHDDHNPSLVVGRGDDGKILMHCRSHGCDYRQICYAVGISPRLLFPDNFRSEPDQRVVAEYDFCDADGVLLYRKQRLEPGREGRSKEFIFLRPNGRGGFVKGMGNGKKVLYGTPQLAASPDATVYVLEGEKACDYVAGEHGLVCVCNHNGAGNWAKVFSEQLRGRDVVVVPDADDPGHNHAQIVCGKLQGIAASVRRVVLPDAAKTWGLDDWLNIGRHDIDEFLEMVESVEPWAEPKQPDAEQIDDDELLKAHIDMLRQIGITYAAEDVDHSILLFSSWSGKFARIRDIGRFRHVQLAQIVGPRLKLYVTESNDDIPGMVRFREIKESLACVAGNVQAADEMRGVGIWPRADGGAVICNRGSCVLTDGAAASVTTDPHHDGEIYDVGSREEWCDSDVMAELINAADAGYRREAASEMVELFGHWRFAGDRRCEVYPCVLAGAFLATAVQALLRWRPQVFLIGRPNSGKSLLLQTVAEMFGPLAEKSSGSTAAAIRIAIGSSSRVGLVDELEQSRHRKDILEMIRASGRGDNVMRATSRQDVNRFSLRQMFWCASTESGLTDEADQSRFIAFEIQSTPHFDMPSQFELRELGLRGIVTAVTCYREALELIEILSRQAPEGVSSRVCETMAVPVAMYAAAMGLGRGAALTMLLELVQLVVDEMGEIESDSDRLLHDIMLSTVILDHGKRESVMELLERIDFEPDNRRHLERVGISIDSVGRVHFNKRLVQQHLVPENWNHKRIDQILMRCDGAQRDKKKFVNGKSLNTISMPKSELRNQSGTESF